MGGSKRIRNSGKLRTRGLGVLLATMFASLFIAPAALAATLQLTPAEQQWLDDHPQIRLAAYGDYPPAQFLDDDGRHAGLAAEYQHLIEAMLGIEFVEVPSHDWDQILQDVRERKIDLLALAADTPDRRPYLAFTEPYLNLSAVIIARDSVEGPLKPGQLEGMHVAVSSGYAVHDYLKTDYPQLTLDAVADTRAGLRKVAFGMADVFITDLAVASYYIEQEGISNLHIVGESGFVYHMGFAPRSDWPELTTILDKALREITPEQRTAIADRWIKISSQSGVSSRRFWITLLIALGVVIGLLTTVVIWTRSLRRLVDQKTHQLKGELQERRRTATALESSEERVRLIIDTALDGVITMNIKGIITGWNRQAEADFGWSAEEALGQVLSELIIPLEHRAAHTAGLEQFRKTGEGALLNKRIEIYARHRDGHAFPVELTIASFRKGETFEFSAFIRDITDRQRAEVELIRHREHLEDLVTERTSELRQAKEEADIANRAKGEFLANMSHEIRTPMTAILGYAAILRESGNIEDAPPERIDALDTICRNGDHLLTLINNILDLSKLEAGKMMTERIECSPAEIAYDVVHLMEVRAREKGLILELAFDGPVPKTILSDPTRLRQIIVNLVGNALKFTGEGRVTVTLRFDDQGAYPVLGVSVRDTGIGMDESQRKQLFQPFTQADTSTTRQYGGTGLGLSISRHYAELLGGEIMVESRPGEGSTFSVEIATGPVDGVDMIEDLDHLSSGRLGGRRTESTPVFAMLRGRRILLAEDTLDNQRLIRHHLEKVGIDVEIVGNGLEALACVERRAHTQNALDAILMDIQMPVMDGYAATRAIRERGFDLPIIALTASTLKTDRDRCVDAGMTDHVAKPIDPQGLLEALVRAVGATPSEASAVRQAGNEASSVPNRDTIRARFGSAELLSEVVELFLGESESAVGALRAAAEAGDLERLEHQAHRLKGCAGNFDAADVTRAAVRLESIARSHETSGIDGAVTELVACVDTLRSVLIGWRDDGVE